MKPYPQLGAGALSDVQRVMQTVVQQRTQDVSDFDNLNQTFTAGRSVSKIPTGADTTADDRVGDTSSDADFTYKVINNSGTAQWVRIAHADW